MDGEKLNIKKGKLVLDASGFAIPISREDWEANHSNIETYEEYCKLKKEKEVELLREYRDTVVAKESNNG